MIAMCGIYDQMPSTQLCDCHLQSFLMASPERQWGSRQEKSQAAAIGLLWREKRHREEEDMERKSSMNSLKQNVRYFMTATGSAGIIVVDKAIT